MSILTIEYLVIVAWLFLLGSTFGSLLNVCVYRLPLDERFWPALRSLVSPPSHCPRCNTRIRPRDNIPILGWLILGGRCRDCRGTISIRYPLIEFFTGVLFALVYWFEVPGWYPRDLELSSIYHILGPGTQTFPGWFSPVAVMHCRYAFHMALIFALLVATLIDIDLRVIPDTVTLPAMALGVIVNTLLGQVFLVPLWYQSPAMMARAPLIRFPTWVGPGGIPAWTAAHPHLHGLAVSLAGIIVGGGIVWAVRIVGQWSLKREAMGFGDVVLLAMIGSFVGWQATLVVFFLAPACAILIAVGSWLIWRDREIPYGPYLSLATLLLLLFFSRLWPWTEAHIFSMGPLLAPVALIMFAGLGGLLLLTRAVQTRLGYAVDEPEFIAEWTPGDQHFYQAGERADDRQGQWPRPQWPGHPASRGSLHHNTWRGR